MDQKALLKAIARTGYNVGFGAKTSFATFDIVDKGVGYIGFVSMACGVFGFVYEPLAGKLSSASLTVLGIASLYMSSYDADAYDAAGKAQTSLFNELRDLHGAVKAGADVTQAHAVLKEIEAKFYANSNSRQIIFSDWYAHYKFFVQMQTDWIDEELHFGLWKDKIPLSFLVSVGLSGILLIALCVGLYMQS